MILLEDEEIVVLVLLLVEPLQENATGLPTGRPAGLLNESESDPDVTSNLALFTCDAGMSNVAL